MNTGVLKAHHQNWLRQNVQEATHPVTNRRTSRIVVHPANGVATVMFGDYKIAEAMIDTFSDLADYRQRVDALATSVSTFCRQELGWKPRCVFRKTKRRSKKNTTRGRFEKVLADVVGFLPVAARKKLAKALEREIQIGERVVRELL